MPKKRYLIVLSMLIICTSVFTGAFCLFTVYQSATLHAVTGISLQFEPDERIIVNAVTSIHPGEKVIKKAASDAWWCKSGTDVSISAQIRKGYSFSGWYDGDFKVLDTLQGPYTADHYTVLTAGLELIQYQITYETNGGILENAVCSYNVEEACKLPTPSKEGFLFDGWFEEPDFSGDPVISTVGETGDKIYYAKWIEDPSLRTAFAVYSADDASLSFYKRSYVPAVNETFEGKTVTAIYTGIEELEIKGSSGIPWYNDCSKTVTNITVVDTISPISLAFWFYNTSKCESYDLQKLDTSNVSSMYYAFYQAGYSAPSFEIDLNSWDTSQVSNMSAMFYCAGEKAGEFKLDLSNWDVSNVDNFSEMFYSAGRYASVWTVGDLRTKAVTGKDGLTYHAWDVSGCSRFDSMFSCVGEGADSFTLDVSNWNMSGATNIASMFSAFRRAKTGIKIELDLSKKSVTLEDGTSYTAWDISNYSGSLFYMFGYAGKNSSSMKINIDGWDTSNVTNMRWMFYGTATNAADFEISDLSVWNTSQVTDMTCMFRSMAVNADYSLDLSGWDVSKVTEYNSFVYEVSDKIKAPSFILNISDSLSLDSITETITEEDEL